MKKIPTTYIVLAIIVIAVIIFIWLSTRKVEPPAGSDADPLTIEFPWNANVADRNSSDYSHLHKYHIIGETGTYGVTYEFMLSEGRKYVNQVGTIPHIQGWLYEFHGWGRINQNQYQQALLELDEAHAAGVNFGV